MKKQRFKLPNLGISILKGILLFRNLFKKWGVDTDVLEALLRTKLTVDERKPLNSFVGAGGRSKPQKKTTSWVQVVIFLSIGLLYTFFLTNKSNISAGLMIYFGGLMSVALLSSIMEFSNILIDEKDLYIVFPRPVSDKTIVLSRYLHMLIYVLKLSFYFCTPGVVMLTIQHHWLAGFLLLLQVIWLSAIVVLIVCMAYLLIFRINNTKKIKEFLAKGQIFITIIFVAQFYIAPYLMRNFDTLNNINIIDYPLLALTPSTWVATWQDILIFGKHDIYTLLTASGGLLFGLFAFWFFIKRLSAKFNQKIASLSFSNDSEPTTSSANNTTPFAKKENNTSWGTKISNILTHNDVEKSTFRVIWAMTNRMNEFKMRFYPSFGFLIVYLTYLFLNMDGTFSEKIIRLQHQTVAPLFVIYYCGMILNGAFGQMNLSSKYKASWIYHVTPIAEPGQILSGAYKAILFKYFMPAYLLIVILGVSIFGPDIINDFILGFLLLNMISIITNLFLYNALPFSAPVDYYKSKWYMSFALLFIQGIAFGIHYFILRWETIVWVMIPIASITLYFMLKAYKKQPWSELKLYESI